MRNRYVEWGIIGLIVCLVIVLCAGISHQKNRSLSPQPRSMSALTTQERAYLEEHETITIRVEQDLQYLLEENGGGYLKEYMERVLQPTGLKVRFTADEDVRADGRLVIVTDAVRSDHGDDVYTSPLFQVEGALFLKKGTDAEHDLHIALTDHRLSEKRKNDLTFRNRPMEFTPSGSVRQTLQAADAEGTDGLISDRSAVCSMLKAQGREQDYVPLEKEVYRLNVCILTASDEAALSGLLNTCIHDADRHSISYEASQRWMGGDGPVYMKRTSGNAYLPVVIILISVLLIFLIYYLTNRDMYRELDERLDRLKASKNELQTTFHGVGHFLAELALDGTVMDMNQAFLGYAGVWSIGKKVWDAFAPGGREAKTLQRKVREGAEGVTGERVEMRVGRKIFAVDIFPIEDARGSVEKLLFMAIDVTQERMAKRQMLQDNKMIAIGQLAAGIAHEIRNPLGIIRNYSYVLKTMDDPDVRKKAIEEIEKAVDNSGAIINNLLDLARVSPKREEQIDVGEHIRSILTLNKSTFRSEDIHVEIICPEPIRTYMRMESFDMILLNLATNAADAMKGGGSLTIELEKGNGEFTMAVSDTGIGIAEDALEEIYNPFYTTKGTMGTGLGLYIVYNEIEKLEGSIEVESTPGEGTTFLVTLPIREHASGQQSGEKDAGNRTGGPVREKTGEETAKEEMK